jgi:hypothetical protein
MLYAEQQLFGGANDGGSVRLVAHTLVWWFGGKFLFRLARLSLLAGWLRDNHGVH